MAIIDLTGQRFGHLMVIKEAGRNNARNATWVCECDCGKSIITLGITLRNGGSQSCGCMYNGKINSRHQHGQKGTHFYHVWKNMKARCNNQNHKNYNRYGQRGIKVCQEWDENFINFYNDMQESYNVHVAIYGTRDTTIERIDNDKGYCFKNCKWATHAEQNANTSSNKRLTFNGESHTISEWSKITGLNRKVIWDRVYGWDWTVERALTTPVRPMKKSSQC